MRHTVFRRLAVCALAGVSMGALGISAPASAQAETILFDIPAQDMAAALEAFGRQSGREIIFDRGQVTGKRTTELHGKYAPDTALRLLVRGTNLVVRSVNSSTFMVETEAPRVDGDRRASAPEDRSEIVVTGTRIRGVGASAGTEVKVVSRDEIDRSGYGSVHEFIKTIPQHFGGGAIEDVIGGTQVGNFSSATSVNLRGLGNSSTLALLNGRRLPVAGLGADFADISSIPTAALERIEVLPDGASAIYGADAVAGVVNFILRDDYKGAETRLHYGSVTKGSLDEFSFGQTFGTTWDTGNLLVSYEYFDRGSLAASDRRLAASADLRPLGGRSFLVTGSNPGNIYDLTTFQPTFAVPRGQNGMNLQPGDFLTGALNMSDPAQDRDIFPRQRRHSVFFNINQKLGDHAEIFAQGIYGNRKYSSRAGHNRTTLFIPDTNAFFVDPTGQGFPFVFMDYDLSRDLGPSTSSGDVDSYIGAFGGSVDIAGDWKLRLQASYGREDSLNRGPYVDTAALDIALADSNPATAFNPFGDGSFTNPDTLASIAGVQTVETLSQVYNVNAIADGTIFQLPGGPAKLAFGADYRVEKFRDLTRQIGSITDNTFLNNARRNVVAGFGELFLPVVSNANATPGIRLLTISAAVRVDDYIRDRRNEGGLESRRSIGTTVNPKFGVTWGPTKDLKLRGTFGTSFRAPNLPTVGGQPFILPFTLSDPSSPTGATRTLFQTGTNRNLKNETAKSWTLGLDWNPEAIPGLDMSVTYYNIHFKNRITSPSNPAAILFDEDRFSSLITRNPTQQQLDALCSSPDFFGDPSQCTTSIIGAIIDGRLSNVGRTNVDGMDIRAHYGRYFEGIGNLDLTLDASYMFHFKEAIGADSKMFETLNTLGSPVDFHMRNSLVWHNSSGFSATLFHNYYDSYKNPTSTLKPRIGSWTTFDLSLSYDTSKSSVPSLLNNTIFAVSIQNLFDNDPPFADNPSRIGYDPANSNILGRFISVNLTKRW